MDNNTRLVNVNNLRDGLIVAEDVKNSLNQILLAKGSVFKSTYSNKILRFGIKEILVDVDNSLEISKIKEDIHLSLDNALSRVFITELYEDLKIDKDVKQVKQLVEDIIRNITSEDTLVLKILDIRFFDEYTLSHSINVALLSILFGITLGLEEDDLYTLGLGAIFHDIGKTAVPIDILNKEGKLTDIEKEVMDSHSMEGYLFAQKHLELSEDAMRIIVEHHEKVDGTGYPKQLVGDDISLFARIVAIVDIYDALVADRPYRKGFLPTTAIEIIMAETTKGKLDKELVDIFSRKIALYPVGTKLLLSNNNQAIVIRNNKGNVNRPVVKQNGVELDLSKITNVVISKVL